MSSFLQSLRTHALFALACSSNLWAISEENVLVVFNSASADSQSVKDYYLTKRPAVRVYDLADSSILSPTISYADFASKIRNPIRSHLNSNNLEQTVEVIVLTKGIPHRIQSLDPNNPNLGDSGGNSLTAYNAGNVTFASVDSELTLLHHDLESGEAGGSYDSHADNPVLNPYYKATASFSSFDRASIASPDLVFSRSDNSYGWWALGTQTRRGPNVIFTPSGPGNIYLTARLDADTVQDVKDLIDRAQDIAFRSDIDAIILDEDDRVQQLDRYSDPISGTLADDYTAADNLISSTWDRVIRDSTTTFLKGNAANLAKTNTQVITGPIAHLHSYGANHIDGGAQVRPYLTTFAGQPVPGASFSAYESFGARGLGGLGNSGQGQVEEWLSAGGTFATGPVWEPLTLGILRSEIFLDRFLNRDLTYVEAAWAGILQISWQSVVIGDPLAKAAYRPSTAYEKWVFGRTGTTPDVDATSGFGSDFENDGLANGLEYVLDLDPNLSGNGSPKLPRLTVSGESRILEFTLGDPVPDGVEVTVETSPSLAADSWSIIASRSTGGVWSGAATVEETNTTNGNEVVVTDNSEDPTGRRFYRISASQLPQ